MLKIADLVYDFFYLRGCGTACIKPPEAVYMFLYLIGVIFVIPILAVIYCYAFKEKTRNFCPPAEP